MLAAPEVEGEFARVASPCEIIRAVRSSVAVTRGFPVPRIDPRDISSFVVSALIFSRSRVSSKLATSGLLAPLRSLLTRCRVCSIVAFDRTLPRFVVVVVVARGPELASRCPPHPHRRRHHRRRRRRCRRGTPSATPTRGFLSLERLPGVVPGRILGAMLRRRPCCLEPRRAETEASITSAPEDVAQAPSLSRPSCSPLPAVPFLSPLCSTTALSTTRAINRPLSIFFPCSMQYLDRSLRCREDASSPSTIPAEVADDLSRVRS